jgi:hypothetical protein
MFFQTDGKNLTAEILSVFEGKKRFILLTKLFSCAIMKIVDFTTKPSQPHSNGETI